jgi:hypothetical protein
MSYMRRFAYRDGWVQVSRDGFARFDTVRRVEQDITGKGCSWCGQHRTRNQGKNVLPTLFEYGTWHDGGRLDTGDGKLFCSLECCKTYYT